jgi:hypothetical protein
MNFFSLWEKKLRRRQHKNNEINPLLEPVKPRLHPQNIIPYDHIFQLTLAQLAKKNPVLCRNPRYYFQVHNNPKTLFIIATDAHYYKFVEMLKQFKVITLAPTCFGSRSTKNHICSFSQAQDCSLMMAPA